MKNILQILKFEYLTCVKNKAFIVITAVLIGAILLFAFLPTLIFGMISSENEIEDNGEKPVISVKSAAYQKELITSELLKYYPEYEIKITSENDESLKKNVDEEKYAFALIITDELSYTYITKNNSMISQESEVITKAVKSMYTVTAFENYGISADETNQILSAEVKADTITTGTDVTKNYWSAYLLMCVLFVAITSYSQLVAQSVVSEKNSRAMELLITCANPTHLMFGKVIGSGLAGLTQLALILLVSLGSFSSVSSQIISDDIMEFVSFRASTVLYALLFFILGYFTYAFLLGALASFASKSEDLNNLSSPVILLLTGVYMIVIFMTVSEMFNSTAMTVMSYLPFTAPLAMFIRASLSNVAAWEIVLSTAVQILTIYLIGMFAASVYKIGVLMYGNPPKITEIFKMLKLERNSQKRLKEK